MKIIKNSLVAIVFFVFESCSKTETPAPPTVKVYPEENFSESYFSTTGLNEKIIPKININAVEMGTGFAPIVKGKITAIRVKLPVVNNNLRVTIWDNELLTVLQIVTVNVALANTIITQDIPDLDLIKNREYTISMNSDDWFEHTKLDNSALIYPFVIGNIKILNYKQYVTTYQFFPVNQFPALYTGDLSFDFQRTE